MTAVKKYVPHYTVDDYSQWDGDWELWEGIAVAMTPSPFGRHQALATKLARLLGNEIDRNECSATVINEVDWVVSSDTVVRPDVIVVCGDPPERHVETTPSLVAEVISKSTKNRDREYKRDLYEEQGVGVYLLLDPDAQTLEVYQRDVSGKWQHQAVIDAVDFRVCEDCDLRLERAKLFSLS